ncbi:hypothetical protein QA601_01745 [Chitinispirillales bacterium ANBcel5]|uniref:hypothetical protein n=1 Tax=Cellulosispirillum alkaliphilum TaxID=3039283 RepID=UPI002A58FC65|nr:hypothetical protein [Chitinispirillales bacterium ANBcel5]
MTVRDSWWRRSVTGKKDNIVLAMLALVVIGFETGAQWLPSEQNTEVRGFLGGMPIYSFSFDPDEQFLDYLIHSRLDFTYFLPVVPVTLHGAVRLQVFWGEQAEAFGLESPVVDIIGEDRGIMDLTGAWGGITVLNMDRLYLSYSRPSLRVTVGRQRVNWGTNYVWNPNDWFNAYEYLDFDYEERPGSDALRVQYYPGVLSLFEAALGASEHREERVYALLYRFNRFNYDLQFQGGFFGLDAAGGFSWSGSIGGAGFRGELSTYLPFLSEDDGVDIGDELTTVTAISGDYMFANGLHVIGEALYNGFGDNGIVDTVPLLSPQINAKNLTPARFLLYSSVSYPFVPLLQGALSVMFNPDDQSLLLQPSLDWSVATNLDLLTIAQLYIGDDGTVFGQLPNLLAARLRYYF